MRCPACAEKLKRVKYEDLIINQCPKCRGFVLDVDRLRVIQSRRQADRQQMEEDIAAGSEDTLNCVQCPKCLQPMEKRPKHLGTKRFFTDRCKRCNLVWLDAGELAKLQLKFETGERGIEQAKMIARRANMTDEEKKELENRIDALPEYDAFEPTFGSSAHDTFDGDADDLFDTLAD